VGEEEVILLGADEAGAAEDYAPAEETGFWPAEEPSEEEPEPVAAKTNGSGPHEPRADESSLPAGASVVGGQTLEDSIKDMLRPMLRQWLEENMARVLTSALKDELKNDETRGPQD
jgi:cell pole-organizing protein PopZ